MENKLIIISIISLLLFSCSAGEYTHNPYNVAGFTEKGETRISGSYGIDLNGIGNFNFNGAYALTDYLSVGASASYVLGEYNDYNPLFGSFTPNNIHKIDGSYFDLGMGYYGTRSNDRFLFENYLGYGHAKIQYTVNDLDLGDITYFSHVNYHKLFNQLSVGYRNPKKYFEIYLPLRVSYILFHDVVRVSGYADTTPTVPKDKFVYSIGPVIRLGTERVKLELSNSYYNYPLENEFQSSNVYYNIGITILDPFDFFKKSE